MFFSAQTTAEKSNWLGRVIDYFFNTGEAIAIFLVLTILVILILASVIATMFYLYDKEKNKHIEVYINAEKKYYDRENYWQTRQDVRDKERTKDIDEARAVQREAVNNMSSITTALKESLEENQKTSIVQSSMNQQITDALKSREKEHNDFKARLEKLITGY